MCALCFDAVISALDSSYVNKVTEEYNEVHDEAYAVFVTWKKMSDSQQNITTLRGCIGTFSPVRIPEGIIVFAKKSGFEDSRFPPISLHEVPCLKVAVSLLEKFEECPNGVEDWTLGIHGIRIIYAEKYTATFLPEVAIEQSMFSLFGKFIFVVKTLFFRLD